MLNCLLGSYKLSVSQSCNKKLITCFLLKNNKYLIYLPIKLTPLSGFKTFFCNTETVNIAVKIHRKTKHEVGRGILPHTDKSALPVATAPQQSASPAWSVAGTKCPGFNTPQSNWAPKSCQFCRYFSRKI